MAPKQLKVSGIEALVKELDKLEGQDSVYILFSGSKGADGKSWCPDCVKAEPFIEKEADKQPASTIFIYCDVGQRDEWKNPKNSFRTDQRFHLTAVPTLMKWNSPKRLVEGQCWEDDMLKLIFEDD